MCFRVDFDNPLPSPPYGDRNGPVARPPRRAGTVQAPSRQWAKHTDVRRFVRRGQRRRQPARPRTVETDVIYMRQREPTDENPTAPARGTGHRGRTWCAGAGPRGRKRSRGDVLQGRPADPAGQLPGLPPAFRTKPDRPDRADVVHGLRGNAALGSRDCPPGGGARDAALVRLGAAGRLLQRAWADCCGDRHACPLGRGRGAGR